MQAADEPSGTCPGVCATRSRLVACVSTAILLAVTSAAASAGPRRATASVALQTSSGPQRPTTLFFSMSSRLEGLKDGEWQILEGPRNFLTKFDVTARDMSLKRLPQGKKRKDQQQPEHKTDVSTEVLPLERETKAAATLVEKVEQDLDEALGVKKPKKRKKYRRACNIFSGEGCDEIYKHDEEDVEWSHDEEDEGDSAQSEETRKGTDAGYHASGKGDASSGAGHSDDKAANNGAGGGDASNADGGGSASSSEASSAEGGDSAASGEASSAEGGDSVVSKDDQSNAGEANEAASHGTAAGRSESVQPGAWWEDGNPDTTHANLLPVSDVVGTKDIPAFFQKDDESVPDEAKAEIAQAMIKADGLRRTRDQNAGSKDGSAGGKEGGQGPASGVGVGLTPVEETVLGHVKTCDTLDDFLNNGRWKPKVGATVVSVGIFVINFDRRRSKQKRAAATGEASIFFVDFMLTLTQPSGSTMWTDDATAFDSISFRNAKEVYESTAVDGAPNTRRIKAAFFYDPNLRMYPMDKQQLTIEIEQKNFTSDQWDFAPSPDLNGLSTTEDDMSHKKCSADVMYAHADGKAYSTFVFKLQVRKARVYAIVTGFIPPLLICMPVLLSLFLGPASWAPKRHMVSGLALVSIAFFYDSYLRQLPVLQYLTAFDKFIYCIYLWIVATMVSLAMLQYVFRDAKEDKVDLMEEGGFDETGAEKLYLTVHLRNDMLHFSFFSALIWAYMLAALFFLWLWLPEVLMCLVLLVFIVAYLTWLWLSYNRMRKRHSLEQEESGGISGILTRQAAGNTEAAKGRSFQWSMMLCCCYGPFITLCLRECCCCFGFTGGTFSEEDEKEEDPDEFPPHLYSSGDEACVICKKAGYSECIFGHSSTEAPAAKDSMEKER